MWWLYCARPALVASFARTVASDGGGKAFCSGSISLSSPGIDGHTDPPNLDYAHCSDCQLQWVVPDPADGVCTRCAKGVKDGRLMQQAGLPSNLPDSFPQGQGAGHIQSLCPGLSACLEELGDKLIQCQESENPQSSPGNDGQIWKCDPEGKGGSDEQCIGPLPLFGNVVFSGVLSQCSNAASPPKYEDHTSSNGSDADDVLTRFINDLGDDECNIPTNPPLDPPSPPFNSNDR